MSQGKITDKQREILEYIKEMILKKGYPPAVREICEAVHLKSTSSVHSHLESLEKNGAIVKRSAVKPEMLVNTGTAKCFDSEEEAIAAIYAGKIVPGDIVVIRYEGPAGGPGMREMLSPTSAIVGMKLDTTVALLTDGRFSGASCGAAIGHISPEAAAGGPIAYIKDGDKIAIDIPNYSLKLLVSDEEMEERKKTMKIREPKKLTGYLKRYAKNVSSADKGAIVE